MPRLLSRSCASESHRPGIAWWVGRFELAFRAMPTLRFRLIAPCAMVLLSSCDSGAGRIDTACRSNSDCADTQLCATGLCEGGLGYCVERPTACPDTDSPVCGCDGRTYQNDCFADLAGIRLAQTGACVCEGNSECVGDQFCALDDSCNNQGTCLPRPETCDPNDTQAVCGCDDMTYANECSAFQAGVRVSALGSCDCTTNANCETTEYCNAITCDGPGLCETRPEACPPPEGAAVIGCDGVEYESECDAALDGIRARP
jgi:hypothetical protein